MKPKVKKYQASCQGALTVTYTAKNCPLFVDVMKFEINYTHIQGAS
jgi:hypothetical protein